MSTDDASKDDPRAELAEAILSTTAPTRLEALAGKTRSLATAIANNPAAPPALLAKLAESNNTPLRQCVAENPATTVETLALLAKDAEPSVRTSVARNAKLRADLLAALGADQDSDVRVQVARHAATPPETRLTLVRDPDPRVRSALAESHSATADILSALARDAEPHVRAAAAAAAALPGDDYKALTTDRLGSVRAGAARSPNVASVMARFVVDDDPEVRAALASNPATAPKLLTRLTSDAVETVVAAAARNPSTPADDLLRLADHTNRWVRDALAANPSTPVQAYARLASGSRTDTRRMLARGTSRELLARLAVDKDVQVRCLVAANPDTPHDILLALSHDPDALVREALRRNRTAAPDVLEASLAEDEKRSRREVLPEGPLAYWLADVAANDAPADTTSRSSLGGPAHLPAELAWPTCSVCSEPMMMFVQITLDPAAGFAPRAFEQLGLAPGFVVQLFGCRHHDERPGPLSTDDGRLAASFWRSMEGTHAVLVHGPDSTLVARPQPEFLAHRELRFIETPEQPVEVGRPTDRFFTGARAFKVGGIPSWTQEHPSLVCACGAPLVFAFQIPSDFYFPRLARSSQSGAPRRAQVFLGAETYVLVCPRPCDPRSAVALVQD